MIRVKRSRRHSEKPLDAHRAMERAIVGPYLELFARWRVPGWTCCGNQLAPADDHGHLFAAD
jgi:N6-adenosine-specific RNA methylase IME4